jgi:hypothetical protein
MHNQLSMKDTQAPGLEAEFLEVIMLDSSEYHQ